MARIRTIKPEFWTSEQVVSLTTVLNQAYPFTATAKSVVGCENLNEAAESRKLDRLAAFFVLLGMPFMAGRAGKPQGLPVPHRVLTPVSVCHPSVRRGMAVIKTAIEAHIMTTKSTRASARRKSKSVSRFETTYLTPELRRHKAIKELNNFLETATEAEKRVVGHLKVGNCPVSLMKEIRRLLDESIKQCKVFQFPAAKQHLTTSRRNT